MGGRDSGGFGRGLVGREGRFLIFFGGGAGGGGDVEVRWYDRDMDRSYADGLE